jgi:hypothetical protein
MDEHFLNQEFEYVANKLDLTSQELRMIFDGQNKTFNDYKNKKWIIDFGAKTQRILGMEKRLFR